MASSDSLPLTRLEGLKDLTRQLHHNKGQIRELLRECHGMFMERAQGHVIPYLFVEQIFFMFSVFPPMEDDPTDSVLLKLVLNLLQLCKLAANHPGGADILGR